MHTVEVCPNVYSYLPVVQKDRYVTLYVWRDMFNGIRLSRGTSREVLAERYKPRGTIREVLSERYYPRGTIREVLAERYYPRDTSREILAERY
jgi:hypothetical protein